MPEKKRAVALGIHDEANSRLGESKPVRRLLPGNLRFRTAIGGELASGRGGGFLSDFKMISHS
jgi:hypothetical protein